MDAGLESVVAAETVLSDVDGLAGRLVIRGHALAEIAQGTSFEALIDLLWQGFFPDLPASEDIAARLAQARVAAYARMALIPDVAPVEAMRIALCLAPDGDGLDQALALTATAGVATAAVARRALGLPLVPPDPNLSHAADMLWMMSGKMPSAAAIAGLTTYLVTVSDHGLNASTFAARVVASTRAGLASATIAGLSALKGPLHGGAPGPVLDMLDAIGSPENAAKWIDQAFARGERLMGFGHRVYRVRDPRADALKAALAFMPSTAGRAAYAQAIEAVALSELADRYPTRKLETNVEFYTAILLEALDIPRDVFTCVFGCGRIVGWIAHAKEQLATNRLVRPLSIYRGPTPSLAA